MMSITVETTAKEEEEEEDEGAEKTRLQEPWGLDILVNQRQSAEN